VKRHPLLRPHPSEEHHRGRILGGTEQRMRLLRPLAAQRVAECRRTVGTVCPCLQRAREERCAQATRGACALLVVDLPAQSISLIVRINIPNL
jgi:hypothetical protein